MRNTLHRICITACILSFFWIAGISGGLECDTMTIGAALFELPCAFFLMISTYKISRSLEKKQKKTAFSK